MNNINSYIGGRILELRLEKDITQKELADKLLTNQTEIKNIEVAKGKFINLKLLYKIANYFEVDIKDIMPTCQWVFFNENRELKIKVNDLLSEIEKLKNNESRY